MRLKNLHNVIIGNLNINSLRFKFDQLKLLLIDNIDILVLTESKLDESFPSQQFNIEGYLKPFRLDRNSKGGGVLIYIKENIGSRILTKHDKPFDIEFLIIELNFRRSKWLLIGTYHPPSQNDQYYFDALEKTLDNYSLYEKVLIVGDFNAQESEACMDTFLYQNNLKNIVKQKTCFKNINNPTTIDLIITNSPSSFQHTAAYTTGLSDFHKLVITVFKTTIPNDKPKEILYRDYKNFDAQSFNEELTNAYASNDTSNYSSFYNVYMEILHKHAPQKKKVVRANHAPYVSKKLRKAIMKRSCLKNSYYKNQNDESLREYKRHKNYCSRLYKKEKKQYFNSLNPTFVKDSKNFWKNINSFFSDKGRNPSKITLSGKDDEIISKDKDICNELNYLFENAANSLGCNENSLIVNKTDDISDPVDKAIQKFEYHPSILMINKSITENHQTFSFEPANFSDVSNKINELDPKKSNGVNNIPSTILKLSSGSTISILHNLFNKVISDGVFPDTLKKADITPIFKKDNPLDKKNYRPISVLPVVSKLFERILQKQINAFIDSFLSPYLCGYRKGYSAQQALVSLIEKWKISLDNKGFAGAILMDLSKAFDTINHDLLIAKLHAYGFSKSSLKVLHSYLSKRFQRTKINNSYSSWSELIKGVPQGSVLGPILFNIYINDLFYITESTEFCNFADDTTIYTCDLELNSLLQRLELDASLAVEWFEYNYMKLNEDKCSLIVSGHKHEQVWAMIGDSKIWESNKSKLLGIVIDRQLNFDDYVFSLCKKAGRKLSALSRLSYYLTLNQRKVLMNSFIQSQFSYSPLTWMFHGRKANNRINHIHERTLRLVYQDQTLSFEELLKKDGSCSIHHRNIQLFSVELFKAYKNKSNQIMKEIFEFKEVNYNLRNQQCFSSVNVKTNKYGINSLRFFASKVWNILPQSLKNLDTVEAFKLNVKKWIPLQCNCKLCQIYIRDVGLIDNVTCV